jgi:hypothetical protein
MPWGRGRLCRFRGGVKSASNNKLYANANGLVAEPHSIPTTVRHCSTSTPNVSTPEMTDTVRIVVCGDEGEHSLRLKREHLANGVCRDRQIVPHNLPRQGPLPTYKDTTNPPAAYDQSTRECADYYRGHIGYVPIQ